jgi:NTP pyrophosphatase (non-canonical NTP hydrolase)
MIDLRQKELQYWQLNNFGECDECDLSDMIHGMSEEVGEMNYWYLKGKQKIHGITASVAKEKMADAFGDIVVFGIQAMNTLGLDAEDVLRKVFNEVLSREWYKMTDKQPEQMWEEVLKLVGFNFNNDRTFHLRGWYFGNDYMGQSLPSLDLNNFFKWVVPKLDKRIGVRYIKFSPAGDCEIRTNGGEVYWNKLVESRIDFATALLQAVWEVIHE